MSKRTTGRYESVTAGGEKVDAFVPFELPPVRPVLVIDTKLERRLGQAEQALVRLDLAGEMVPSLDWFIYAFVRKEAVISSQIEGTQASLVDLLAFEAEEQPQPNADVTGRHPVAKTFPGLRRTASEGHHAAIDTDVASSDEGRPR